jgi:sugar phosphate permease
VRKNPYLNHRAQLTICSGFVNGIVAYGVSFIHVKLESWRILFMIEGGATVLIAIIAIIVLPDDIQSCRWFTAEEKDFCEHTSRDTGRLAADKS